MIRDERLNGVIAEFNQQPLEDRMRKGRAMLDARQAMNAAVLSQGQGTMTWEEMQRVMAASRQNLPPERTWIDPNGWVLRR